MMYFVRSSRRRWFRKKKYLIPISLLIVACIVAVILGSVFGTRSAAHTSGMAFHTRSNSRKTISHMIGTDYSIAYIWNNIQASQLTKITLFLYSVHLVSFWKKHPAMITYSWNREMSCLGISDLRTHCTSLLCI